MRGVVWRRPGHPERRGGGQAGREEVVARLRQAGHAAAPTGRSLKKLLSVGLGRWWAGHLGRQVAAQGLQVSPGMFSISFSFLFF